MLGYLRQKKVDELKKRIDQLKQDIYGYELELETLKDCVHRGIKPYTQASVESKTNYIAKEKHELGEMEKELAVIKSGKIENPEFEKWLINYEKMVERVNFLTKKYYECNDEEEDAIDSELSELEERSGQSLRVALSNEEWENLYYKYCEFKEDVLNNDYI